MKCDKCPDFVDNICQKAQLNKFSELEGDCLLRIMCVLLRDIVGELSYRNDKEDEGDNWRENNA